MPVCTTQAGKPNTLPPGITVAGVIEAWTIRRTCGNLEDKCVRGDALLLLLFAAGGVVWKGWALGCGFTTSSHQSDGHQGLGLGRQVWLTPSSRSSGTLKATAAALGHGDFQLLFRR